MVSHPTLVQGHSHGVELVENVHPRSCILFSSPLWSHSHLFGSVLYCSVGWIPVILTRKHAVGSPHRFDYANLRRTTESCLVGSCASCISTLNGSYFLTIFWLKFSQHETRIVPIHFLYIGLIAIYESTLFQRKKVCLCNMLVKL